MTVTNALTEPLLVFEDQDPARLSELPPQHPLVEAIASIAATAQDNSVLQQANSTLEIAAQQASIAAGLNKTASTILNQVNPFLMGVNDLGSISSPVTLAFDMGSV